MKFFHPAYQRQALRLHRFAAREALHVVDDTADAPGVAADDLRQAALVLGEMGRLRQQLSRMAHSAHRISDLMRDAGAQAAQGRKLGLLDFLFEQRRVLEEDQHWRWLGVTEWCKVRTNHARAIG